MSKGKLLLLGLTKLSTFASMLAFFAVYWSIFGWKFALGFVLSIYIHEMGHVMALRKYNIAASAPMFIPFFGAIVRMKQYPGNVGEDARVGLAGPIWGLGSAVAAWLAAISTGLPIWYAIAHTAAWLNLFNLLPIWQLDGGRGFRALTRKQRAIAAAVAIGMWAVTHQTILLLIALGAGYRLFSRDYPAEDDNIVLMQYAGLIVLLSMLMVMTDRITQRVLLAFLLQIVVHRGRNDQRQNHRRRDSADHRDGQRLQHLRSGAERERQRDHAGRGGQSGHQNRTQAALAGENHGFLGRARLRARNF